MNYLTVNPPPLQGDEDALTSAAGLNFPFGIPFTNQSAFQSAFTPEGFSFESPFGLPSNSFNNTSSMNGSALAGPSSAPKAKPFSQNSVSGSAQYLNGLTNVIPSDTYSDNLSNSASSVSLVTGDRFSQLLEAKLGLDLAAQNNAMASVLPAQPFPGVSGSHNEPFDHLAVEQALKDYAQIQVPPDFVAPAIPESFLQSSIVQQQFPFSPLTLAPNPNTFNKGQASGSLLPPGNNFYQQSLYGNPATFQTPLHSSAPTPRHSPDHHPNPITPFGAPLGTSQTTSEPPQLPPPLRIHVQQTPVLQQSNLNPAMGSGDMADGSWAMELLKGYKSAQSRLDFPSWSGLVGANSTLPPPPFPQQPDVREAKTQGLSNSLTATSHKMSNGTSAPLPRAESSSRPSQIVGNPRKRPSKAVSEEPSESSDSEYEDVQPRRKKSTTNQRTSTSEESKDGPEKKPVIACHICRARKLKCNGGRPKCSNCIRRNEDGCVYDTVLRRRGPGRNNKKDRRPRSNRQGGAVRTKLDHRRSQSPATESTEGTPHRSQRDVSMGKGVGDPVTGMGWDQVLMSSMVR